MSDGKKPKRKKNQSFGEKLFSRFAKKKKNQDNKENKDNKHKKDKKNNKKNGTSKHEKKSQHGKKPSKPNKIIDVTPAEPEELKDIYCIDDVINYRSQVIRSVNDEKRKNLVTEKLRLCSVRFDFTQIMDDAKANINNNNNNNQNNMNGAQKTKQNGHQQNGKSDKSKMDGVILGNGTRRSHALSKEEIERKQQLTMGIDKKRQMLVEIVEFISTQKWWDENILKELISCVESNLFRTLPLGSKRKFVKGDEEEEPFLDPQWLHLQLVYELCLRFLISNDIDKKVMQKYLHGKFVLNLIQLFQSEDLRERDYLKTILHRIYGRFMPLRQQIRTEIANECYRYVYGSSRGVHGIAEFLDIFSSIINGFSIPVKEEHKAFLRNVLLPLHKCDKYEVYFQQLADCCVLFVNKEQGIATTVLGGLLKFWPRLSPTKQAFYLREMLNVIGALVEHENGFSYPKYKDIVLLCVDKIFECMESPHFQVADQALSLWKDTVMLYLSKCQKDMIWRRLFIIFKDIQLHHWNAGIKQLTNEVVLYYERIDFNYWKKLKEEYENSLNNTTSTSYANGESSTTNTTTTTNGNEKNGENDIKHKIPVIVPKTLVPNRYHNQKKTKRQDRTKSRVSKWKIIKETAQNNKQVLIKQQPKEQEEEEEEETKTKESNSQEAKPSLNKSTENESITKEPTANGGKVEMNGHSNNDDDNKEEINDNNNNNNDNDNDNKNEKAQTDNIDIDKTSQSKPNDYVNNDDNKEDPKSSNTENTEKESQSSSSTTTTSKVEAVASNETNEEVIVGNIDSTTNAT